MNGSALTRCLRSLVWMLLAMLALMSPTHAAAETAPGHGRKMWVYETDPLTDSATAREELFAFCLSRKITDLYWQVHFDSQTKGAPYELRRAATLSTFLREAAAHSLRIHALAGDPSHALTRNHDRVLARVEALLAFNRAASADARFAGLHLDIEPHGLPEWKTADDAEKCRLLTQFVEINAKVADLLHAQASGLVYGVDIVFWLDKVKADGTPFYPVTFRGVTQDAAQHLLGLVDELVPMSYRSKAEGKNGLIEIVSRTIAHADQMKPAHRVFVGVKMAEIGPKLETFFGSTEQEMNAELKKVEDAYLPHEGYGGLAFFMYSAYKAMPQGAK